MHHHIRGLRDTLNSKVWLKVLFLEKLSFSNRVHIRHTQEDSLVPLKSLKWLQDDSLVLFIYNFVLILWLSFYSDMSNVERAYACCHCLRSFHGCHISPSSGKIRSSIKIKNETKPFKKSPFFVAWYHVENHSVPGAGRHHLHLDCLHHCGSSFRCISQTLRNSSEINSVMILYVSILQLNF